MEIAVHGNVWGCGFCGTVGPPAPACCAKGREWCLRFARQLYDEDAKWDAFYATGEAKPSFMDQCRDARWERVVRRWESKRA